MDIFWSFFAFLCIFTSIECKLDDSAEQIDHCCSAECVEDLHLWQNAGKTDEIHLNRKLLIDVIQVLSDNKPCSEEKNELSTTTEDHPSRNQSQSSIVRRKRHDHHSEEEEELEHAAECAEHNVTALLVRHGVGENLAAAQLVSVCPGLLHAIYQRRQHCCDVHSKVPGVPHAAPAVPVQPARASFTTARVWGYAMAATLLVAVAGLGAVALIPLMQRVAFNHVLQIMVALGVGTLLGDAVLHLIPHAIVSALNPSGEVHNHAHDDDRAASHDEHFRLAMCGLTCFAGVYVFYLLEEAVRSWNDVKRRLTSLRTSASRAPLVVNGDSRVARCNRDPMNRCAVTSFTDKVVHGSAQPSSDAPADSATPSPDADGPPDAATPVADGAPTKVARPSNHRRHADGGAASDSAAETDTEVAKEPNEVTKFLLPFANNGLHDHGHDHGHGHGHSHGAAGGRHAAYMVIVGDALHNVSDGLAIGAAFAADVTTGISTTIAVLFHELPHELGDFAILLNSGLSTKKAVLMNLLSSLFAFIGTVIGVAVGNLHSAPMWIFAVIAGAFIYVSLVDMLPQMVNVRAKPGESPFFHFVLQNIGLLAGVGIMLLIALYEEDLKLLFS